MSTTISTMNRIRVSLLITMGVFVLQGCASLGQSNYSCSGKPEGTYCTSMEETYAITDGDDYRQQVQSRRVTEGQEATQQGSLHEGYATQLVSSTAPRPYLPEMEGNTLPIRTPAQVMRIWIAPWENKDGDLMMTGLVYTEIQRRRWQVGFERPDIRDTIRPLGSVQ